MIIDWAVYRHGHRIHPSEREAAEEHDPSAAIGAAKAVAKRSDGAFVWVGLHDPTAEEMEAVAQVFHLHQLAVEDATVAHQRPKLERYPGTHVFMVLKTLWYLDDQDAVETGEISVFVGDDFVVTVRHGQGGELAVTRRDLEEQQEVLGHGPFSVLYSVCDRVVDDYEQVAEALQNDVDEVELQVFSEVRSRDFRRIYTLKRELAEFRRAVSPLREPLTRLAHGEVPEMNPKAAAFFRDVADHAILTTDHVENLDELLSSAHDAHMARISVQQNDDMRKISAWVAMAAVPTLLAGIYGMNFRNMPELRWHYGYFMVLGVMAVACLSLYRIFKRSGWL